MRTDTQGRLTRIYLLGLLLQLGYQILLVQTTLNLKKESTIPKIHFQSPTFFHTSAALTTQNQKKNFMFFLSWVST